MVQCIQDNGLMESVMVLEVKCGQTAQDMKATGWVIKLMDKVSLFMLTVTSTKDNGSMIKHMAKEPTLMLTVHTTTVTGSMTSNTASVWSHGQMVPSMKVTT